jgi:hypothetical protein
MTRGLEAPLEACAREDPRRRRHGSPRPLLLMTVGSMKPPSSATARSTGPLSSSVRCNILRDIIEQDHRGVKRIARPLPEFKSFEAAQDTLVRIELRHLLNKPQTVPEGGDEGLTAAEQLVLRAGSAAQRARSSRDNSEGYVSARSAAHRNRSGHLAAAPTWPAGHAGGAIAAGPRADRTRARQL